MEKEAAVKLKRRKLAKGYIEALTPEHVTNSGKSDGGWMDSKGVAAAGLGFMLTETPDPIDMFISNDAYSRAGFATMQIEVYPPLETSKNKPTTRENLMQYLKAAVLQRENSVYKAGNYVVRDSPRIDCPRRMPGGTTNADLIVTYCYERLCDAEGHDLPPDLTAKEQYAALYFLGKGIAIFKATNFQNHNLVIDFMKILPSIRFIGDSSYLGFVHGINPLTMSFEYAPRSDDKEVPLLCFGCGKGQGKKSGGSSEAKIDLKQCSRCKLAYYCSSDCQKADWKRHKKGECLPRDVE